MRTHSSLVTKYPWNFCYGNPPHVIFIASLMGQRGVSFASLGREESLTAVFRLSSPPTRCPSAAVVTRALHFAPGTGSRESGPRAPGCTVDPVRTGEAEQYRDMQAYIVVRGLHPRFGCKVSLADQPAKTLPSSAVQGQPKILSMSQEFSLVPKNPPWPQALTDWTSYSNTDQVTSRQLTCQPSHVRRS